MKVFRGFDEASGIKNPVVTTGSFDGVHIGHKTILQRLSLLARQHKGESVLITFHPHPRKVLYPDTAGKNLKLISSQEEKLELLRRTGLDNLVIVEFTREFSRITSEEFVRDFLCRKLGAKVIVAGFNHHFGFNQEGDYRQLWGWREKYGFEAEEIPEMEVQNESVSSTRIRKAISEGYIQRANAYLDHYYIIIGNTQNRQTLQTFDFLEVPVTEDTKLLPATGIYAVTVVTGDIRSKGMVIICTDATGNNKVFLHIFDNDAYMSGRKVELLFQKMIYGTVSICDEKTSSRLIAARAEIDDLIY